MSLADMKKHIEHVREHGHAVFTHHEAGHPGHDHPLGPVTTKVIHLEELPPFHANKGLNGKQHHIHLVHERIAMYLMRLAHAHSTGLGCCLLMPSLFSLEKFFHAPYYEIRKAFHWLKVHGHEYMIPGYYGHISLWTHPHSAKPT